MNMAFPSMAFALWPEADRAIWLLNCEPLDDPFDDQPYGATLRPATQAGLIKAYGIWLAFLVSRNELDPSQSPLERVGSEGPSLRKRTVRNENMGEILPISGEKG